MKGLGVSAARALLEYLESVPVGSLDDVGALEGLLSQVWGDFEGGDKEGMTGDKLPGRMEKANWNPPVISFEIERHGGIVLGSSRAEIHSWRVDVANYTATIEGIGRRQIHPIQQRLDIDPLADEIANAIKSRQDHQGLKWTKTGDVQVFTAMVLPAAVKQTMADRKKRLYAAIDSRLTPDGWERNRSYYRFRRTD